MSETQQLSMPVRLLVRLVLTMLLVFGAATLLPRYFFLDGGLAAVIIIGSLITLMNVLVRPLLHVVTFPLKLFATLLAIVVVNGVFLWLTTTIASAMDPNVVRFAIDGGLSGWIIAAFVFGIGDMVIRGMVK